MRARIIHELPTITAEHFIPLGHACRPAYWLQRTGLRTYALPFDWMMAYSLDFVAQSLRNGSADWFSDFSFRPISDSFHLSVTDNPSGMISLHAFPKNKSVAEYLPEFHKIFDNRMARFQETCTNARKVCFVFNRNTGMDGIIEFARNMHKMYPRMKMIMLQVIHNDTEKSICEYRVNRYLTIYTVTDYDIHHKGPNKSDSPQYWIGNINLWDSILSNCHRTTYVKLHIFWKTKNIIPKHKLPIEWRVDIKNHGDADNKVIVNMGGAHVAYPSWYTNETGVGASVNAKLTHGDMEIVAVRDGVLKLNFRGPDRRVDGKRFPYWVDYSSIVIDDNEILTAPVATWHDKPFVYEMPVNHGQVVRVKFTQTPHKYTDTELSEFIDLVSQSDEMTPSEIIKLREYLSDAQK
jgi:hypothetical protein